MAFSSSGRVIATGSWDHSARVWSPAGELLGEHCHNSAVYSVAFSPGEGSVVASALNDDAIGVWEWGAGREQARLAGHNRTVTSTSVQLSPEGDLVCGRRSNPLDVSIFRPCCGADYF